MRRFDRRRWAALSRRPMWRSFRLVTGALARCLCLCHTLRHFRFHGVEVEACTALHWRELDESLECLAHYLLDEHKAPELILEPFEVALRPVFRPVIRPAHALERIEAQVGDIGHVHVDFLPEPALG